VPILVCPHRGCRYAAVPGKPRPEVCPGCEKAVAYTAWRVAPPAAPTDYRITKDDFLFLKSIDVSPE
jgi:hypothetical protein